MSLRSSLSTAPGVAALVLAVGFAPVTTVDEGPTVKAAQELRLTFESAASALDEPANAKSSEIETVGEQSVVEGTPTAAKPTIALFGDSVAFSLMYSISDWVAATDEALFVGGDVRLGCGIGRGGLERSPQIQRRDSECGAWPTRWAEMVGAVTLDVVMVHSGQWEIVDRQLEGEDRWRTIGDPVYDAYLLDELRLAQEVLSSGGATVMWVNLADYAGQDAERRPPALRQSQTRERVARYNELIDTVVAEYPRSATLLDLHGYMADKVNDRHLRPDGAHFAQRGLDDFAVQYLGPTILQRWTEHRAILSAPPTQ